MANKTQRINMRVAPELSDRINTLAKQLGESKNQVIENAIWDYVLNKSKFACCPDCDEPMFDIEKTPIFEGVQEIECSKGHKNVWSFSDDIFLFPQKK